MCLAARHVRPHGDVEDVTACSVGQVELLLVAQGVSLVPEKVQKVGESGVVLLKKKRYRKVISVTSGGKNKTTIFLCKVHKYYLKPSHIGVYLLD